MTGKILNQRKYRLLTSTALTRHVAAFGAIGFALSANSAFALDPNALPQDPNVVGGAATFNLSGPATLNVNQSTDRTVIDWRSFDIGSNATTNFIQPNSSSIAVNRVNNSSNPTEIQGNLNANGQVWILNANGVLFGKTAKIDVAGIVASTANISVQSFMSGDTRLQLTGADGGSVTNEGNITVADGGLAAFVAPAVRNSGTITARVGQVALAAGTTFTLDLAGDRLVEIGLGANNAIVDHSGHIVADGSTVQISARAAGALVDSVVNVSGTVLASSAHEEGGTIVLTADNITTTADAVLKADAGTNGDGGTIYGYADKLGKYDGTFSAQGGSQSGDGGFIETSGKKVQIADGISINTLAANGETGNWTIDPEDLTVTNDGAISGSIDPDASTVTNATVVNQLLTTGVTLAANNSITVDGAINSSGAGNLALNDQNADGNLTINLNAAITLGAGKVLSGQGSVVNVANTGVIQNGVDVAKAGGATVNVAAGDYNQVVTVRKDGIKLAGEAGTKIIVPSVNETNAIDVWANDFTITGFEIAGPAANESYTTYAWGSINTRGVVIHNGATNFTIAENNIHGLRNNILIDGRNTGSVTNNIIDNSKSGISVQYTDAGAGNSEGYVVDISGNSEGVYGNEWGLNTHLNGHYVGATYFNNAQKIAANATLTVQQALLANSAVNGGWTVQDQGYSNSNRTAVTVSTTGDDTKQGSVLGALKTIQAGINAVVTGGAVNVAAGTYNENVTINKSGLTLLSDSGRDATTIVGQNGGAAQGAVYVESGANNFTLGSVGHGFTVIGLDGPKERERAAVYFQGDNSGSTVRGNRITANGDGGLMSESGRAVTNLTIDSNIFDGQTFAGPTAGGLGFGGQFTVDNVPRQLVVLGSGAGTTTTNHIAFTNNEVIGTAGGLNSDGVEQGNTLVTIDAADVTITGNTFAGTTTRFGDALRARGSNTTISGNTFDGTNMGAGTNLVNLKDGALSGTFADVIANNVWKNGAWVDRLNSGYNYVYRSVQKAVNDAIAGDTVNAAAGTYAGNISINKGITLAGAGMDETALTGGINIPNSPAISDLTFRGFTVSGASSNAIVKQGRVTNFTVDHVRFDGENVVDRMGFASGQFGGDISITNSEFVNIRGWSAFDTSTGGQVGVITSVNFSNNLLDNTVGHITFRQATPNVAVTIADNIVRNVGDTSDLSSGIFKVFGATTVDFLRNNISDIGANGVNHLSTTAGILDGAALIVSGIDTLNVTNNIFTNNQEAILVGAGNALPTTTNITGNTFSNNAYDIQLAGGVGSGTLNFGAGNSFISGANTEQHLLWGGASNVDMTNVEFDGKLGSAMTNVELFALEDLITHGTDLASSGLVTVKAGNVYVTTNSGSVQRGIDKVATGGTVNVNSGTYGAFGTSFGGASDVKIQGYDAIIDGTGLTGRIIDLRADGTTLSGFTINGDGGGVGVSISGQGVTVSGNTINGTLTGVQTTTQYSAGNAIISGNTINTAYGISLQNTGNTVSGNTVTASAEGVGLAQGANTFTGNTFNIGASSNAMKFYGGASASDLTASDNTVTIAGGGLQGAVDLTGADGHLNVLGGTYNEDVVVDGASRNISFTDATLNKFTQNVASAIGGTVTAVNGFFLNAATTLLSNTVLNGSVTATSIDGSTAGGQTLALNGGNNALGSLGATTRLGATSISGATTLDGSTYAANALSFAGPVTLTQALTTFNATISPSAAGDITFTGSIFGTTDGAQNVAFIAGSGTGAAGANGDISLQNAGTDALWLGSVSATGDDFSGATVYVGGDYNSTLTGNQAFTSNTLHTRGSVTSNVGGDATGPIVSGGNVDVTAGGNFNGNVTAPTGTVSGNTVTGTFTGNTFNILAVNGVDVDVFATTLNLTSPSGTVDGTFTNINTGGSGSLVVNGKTRTGNLGTNPNQIVVEGYTLPAGSIVTPSGEIILPNGMMIGLVSPQAGPGATGSKPKIVVVHSVQRLGELLAQGYVAIIIDLSKDEDDQEEIIALAN